MLTREDISRPYWLLLNLLFFFTGSVLCRLWYFIDSRSPNRLWFLKSVSLFFNGFTFLSERVCRQLPNANDPLLYGKFWTDQTKQISLLVSKTSFNLLDSWYSVRGGIFYLHVKSELTRQYQSYTACEWKGLIGSRSRCFLSRSHCSTTTMLWSFICIWLRINSKSVLDVTITVNTESIGDSLGSFWG